MLLAGLLVLSTNASSEGALFKVSYQISLSGVGIASPVLIVREGEPASIKLERDEGAPFALSVTAAASEQAVIRLAHDLSVGDQQWTPEIHVREGESGGIKIDDLEITVLASRYHGEANH